MRCVYNATFAVALVWAFAGAAHGSPDVRVCAFVPGVSVPAKMPVDLRDSARGSAADPVRAFAPTRVSAQVTSTQLRILEGLSDAVATHYVDVDFNGRDWPALVARYRVMVERGLSVQDFAAAMHALVGELGDDHSHVQDPQQVQDAKRIIASQHDFVGVGALFTPIGNTGHAAVMSVFGASPAAAAGLQSHDVLLAVDGGPVRDSAGKSRTLGVDGTKVRLQMRRPADAVRELTLTRRRVSGRLPIEYCLLAEARIGYLFLPTLLDRTMVDQVREALRDMTAAGPMRGLVLDNRMNGGGLGSVMQGILGLFVADSWGEFVIRSSREPLRLEPEDIGGSQRVPLIVLVDRDTASFGEIMSGVLRVSGRATIVGGHTAGNVEQLRAYDLPENWRLWLASATFQPRGMTNGVWERVGIVPDISLPTRWDLFTQRDDPAFAKAVEVLGTHR